MTTHAREVNFDGLVGPTHNYAGLSYGNVASMTHATQTSSPRQAALQGLAKMRLLASRGIEQAVLPPQERPDVHMLRALGFTGDDGQVLARAAAQSPVLLAACSSASSMWAANAATVSPSADTVDGRLHFTPANLVSQLHRSIEPATTTRVLRTIFRNDARFVVHDPLFASQHLADEGAANHTRLCAAHGERGVELFTFGRAALGDTPATPRRYPARQTREACEAVARRHGLRADATMFVQQHPDAIDAGVFHNDVISVGHLNVLMYHERAYLGGDESIDALRRMFEGRSGQKLIVIRIADKDVPLGDAVKSYLFNSQLVRVDGEIHGGGLLLLYPAECDRTPSVKRWIDAAVGGDGPIAEAISVDLRQSMHNGGGPACLRLRVVMTDGELGAMHQSVRWSPALDAKLTQWVERHYREELTPADLADPRLLAESREALDDLSRLLQLGDIYTFQR